MPKQEREPLPPGILPNVYDTDPPPMHEATVVLDGYVGVDEAKLSKAELAEVMTRQPRPNILPRPEQHETHDERHSTKHSR